MNSAAWIELQELRREEQIALLDWRKTAKAEAKSRLSRITLRIAELEDHLAATAVEIKAQHHLAELSNKFGQDLAWNGELTSLMRAGAEIKNGNIALPVASGKTVELWPAEVLAGELPAKDGERKAWLRVRASVQPEYRRAWIKMITATMKYRSEGVAWSLLDSDETKALSEGLDTAGGFLAPPDFLAEVLARLPEESIFHAPDGADVRRTMRDTLTVPRFQPHGTSPAVFAGTFVVDWVGETGSPSGQSSQADVDAVFGHVQIPLRKLRARTAVSNDLASDAPYLFASLAQNAAASMGPVEDAAYINGLGSPLQPLGIVQTPGITTVNVAGTTANTISNTTVNNGSAPKIWDLAYSLSDQYHERAMWITRLATEKEIRQLVNAQSGFHFPIEDRTSDGDRALLGYPVEVSSSVPADGVAGNNPIVFGDLKAGYIVASRAELSLRLATENKADKDQTEVICFSRVGGAVVNTDAFRLGVV